MLWSIYLPPSLLLLVKRDQVLFAPDSKPSACLKIIIHVDETTFHGTNTSLFLHKMLLGVSCTSGSDYDGNAAGASSNKDCVIFNNSDNIERT